MVEDIISCMIPLCLKLIVGHAVDFFEVGLIGSRRITRSVYLMIHAQKEYNEVGFHESLGRPMKVVYEGDQFESMHEGSNLDDWDDDSADPLDFQKWKRIS